MWRLVALTETVRPLQLYVPLLASALRADELIGRAYAATSKGWLHGPSLIYDLNVGPIAECVGGHNLKAIAEHVVTGPGAIRGKVVEMSGGKGWLVHPEDLARVVVRGRGRAPELLGSVPPRRAVAGALEFREAKPWMPRLPDWLRRQVRLTESETKVFASRRAVSRDAVVILRREDGSFIVDSGHGVVEAKTQVEAVDLLLETTGGRKTIHLDFSNMQPGEARSFAASVMGRKHAMDRTVAFGVVNAERRTGMPQVFRVEDYRAARVAVKVEESSSSVISGRLELVPGGDAPPAVVKWSIRIRDASVDGLQWPTSKVEAWVERAWKESPGLDEFSAELRRNVQQTLRALFPDTHLVEPKVQLQILQQIEDRWLTLAKDTSNRERIAA